MQEYTIERSVEVDIACSVEEVYNLWENLENMPRWIPLVKEVKVVPGAQQLSRWQFGLGAPLLTDWSRTLVRSESTRDLETVSNPDRKRDTSQSYRINRLVHRVI